MQRNVAANAGLGFADLADLVSTTARRELRRLAALEQGAGSGDASPCRRDLATAAGCQHCAAADAAASAAESLAAAGCGIAGTEAETHVSELQLQQLQCIFNLRRGLFVLEALEAHDRRVLGDAHAAEASSFALDLRQVRVVLSRCDRVAANVST